MKMHADEVDTDPLLVRGLLAAQFPQWAHLPIARVESAGTDNALYRIGDALVARLPRIAWAVGQAEKEMRWLPTLAARLPLAIPVPLAVGSPGEGYPWHWSVAPWIEGENATLDRISDLRQTAIDLAGFVAALWRIDVSGGPVPGPHNSGRGEPLAARDPETRIAIDALRGDLDPDAVTAAWEAALRAPDWSGRPVWLHGDLHLGNLLAQRGALCAVLDFGCLGVGDPACDVMAAWLYLPRETRDTFRAALEVDDASWARARGWALSVGLIALPYYKVTNPVLAGIARRAIDEVFADDGEIYRTGGL